MKTLDQYLGTPGFYISNEDPPDLIVVNDEKVATFLNDSNATQRVLDPRQWEVEPVKIKRFYLKVKPKKAQVIKLNP
jgi:hypothetical protein